VDGEAAPSSRPARSWHAVRSFVLARRLMSAFRVVPVALETPAQAEAAAADLFSGVARALRRSAVDTGRADSSAEVSTLVRGLTAEADALADAAQADAAALRAAARAYLSVERRAMEH
jgi:hypothetical protein